MQLFSFDGDERSDAQFETKRVSAFHLISRFQHVVCGITIGLMLLLNEIS